MKKTNLVIVNLVIGVSLLAYCGIIMYNNMKNPVSIRITYTFDDNVSRYNNIAISCLETIDNQNPYWQFTKFKTCGSENQPCVIEGQPRNDTMTTETCEFSFFAPGGMNGNPNPSFTTSKGLASDWALVLVDQSGKTERFVSPRNMQFQYMRKGKVLGSTKIAPIVHPWGANFQATWNKG